MSDDPTQQYIIKTSDPWWIESLKQLGLPTMLVMLFCVGGYQAALWYATNVALPESRRQLEFIDKVEASVSRMSDAIAGYTSNSGKIASELEAINRGIVDLNDTTESNGKKLDKIEVKLNPGGG